MQKQDFLKTTVEHIDIKETNVVPLVEAMGKTAFPHGPSQGPPTFTT